MKGITCHCVFPFPITYNQLHLNNLYYQNTATSFRKYCWELCADYKQVDFFTTEKSCFLNYNMDQIGLNENKLLDETAYFA